MASRHDYESFYRREIAFRKELGYPPFNHFINLTVLSRQEKKSRLVAEHIAAKLRPHLEKGSEILGPAPPPISRARGRYRWQLTIKTGKVFPALNALDRVLPPLGRSRQIKIEVDVDPLSML
jgi:primosomal protein N' (replication factor Y)